LPELAESQCPPTLIIGSPNGYEVVFTIAKRGIEKHRVLVKPIIFKTGAAKVRTFLINEFELLLQAEIRSEILGLGLFFYSLPEVGGFRCSFPALLPYQAMNTVLHNDFDETDLLSEFHVLVA
jgi:hypothetical protein